MEDSVETQAAAGGAARPAEISPEKSPEESALLQFSALADQAMQKAQEVQKDVKSAAAQKCRTCEKCEIKYTCPACGTKSCSVNCVQAHKNQFNCAGQQKTQWREIQDNKMRNYDRLELLADYRFMEGCSRWVQGLKRSHPETNVNPPEHQLDKRRMFLRNACRRRNIEILYAPPQLDSAQFNQSSHDNISDTIMWTLAVAFHKSEPVTYLCHRVAETVSLKTIINQFLTKTDSGRMQITLDESSKFSPDDISDFRTAGCEKVVVFMRAQRCRRECYYKLNMETGIGKQLQNKVIVDFPKIIVALGTDAKDFPLWKIEDNVVQGGPRGNRRNRRGGKRGAGASHHGHAQQQQHVAAQNSKQEPPKQPPASPQNVNQTPGKVPSDTPEVVDKKVNLGQLPTLQRAIKVDEIKVPNVQCPLPNAVRLAKRSEVAAQFSEQKISKSPEVKKKNVEPAEKSAKMRATDYFSILGDFEGDEDSDD